MNDDGLERALAWLREQHHAFEEPLAALVEINSFTENVKGGNRVGAALRELFDLPGFACEATPSVSGRFADHLAFRTTAPGAPVVLVGHLDTVFPPGIFEGYRRDGDLRRGPGVLDMKGGLVVIAFALRALAREGLLTRIPLRLVIVADEEVGSPEGRDVIVREARGASAALVFEAGRAKDAIITRRKGTGGVTAVAHGKAAHAGNLHHEGVNAIWALARFVDEAQRLTDYAAGRTVNVGKLVGGQGKNTVPDRAEALVDLRFCTTADGDALVAALRDAALRAETSVPGARIELTGGVARMPLERSEASAALAAKYGASAHAEGLGNTEAALLGGGSDANTTSALGIPSIDGLGPRGKGFHTVDEQIEAASLVPKAAALTRFLAGLTTSLEPVMSGYLDLHCHWLPCIDDGVASAEEGIALLRGLRSIGFSTVVATPHMRPGYFDNQAVAIAAAFEAFRPQLDVEAGLPSVSYAAEHFFDDIVYGRLLSGHAVPYPGRHAVLLELSPEAAPLRLAERFADVRRKTGLRPVLAHPERYAFVADDITVLDAVLDGGTLALLDVAALVGKYGRRPERAARELLEAGYYYAACSDAHSPSDVERVAKGIEQLRAAIGDEEADFLLIGGPQSIFDGTIEA